MRFLVDECCDPRLAIALRDAGHDAVWARDLAPGASDERLRTIAVEQDRIVVTHDVGFGERMVRARAGVPGLVLIRIRPRDRGEVAGRLLALVAAHGEVLMNAVAVLDDRGDRVRPVAQ